MCIKMVVGGMTNIGHKLAYFAPITGFGIRRRRRTGRGIVRRVAGHAVKHIGSFLASKLGSLIAGSGARIVGRGYRRRRPRRPRRRLLGYGRRRRRRTLGYGIRRRRRLTTLGSGRRHRRRHIRHHRRRRIPRMMLTVMGRRFVPHRGRGVRRRTCRIF